MRATFAAGGAFGAGGAFAAGALAWTVVAAGALALPAAAEAQDGGACATAIVGATIIDGNGGPPVRDGAVLVRGTRIEAVGRRGDVALPGCAEVIDATGRFLTPGFVDTNVHVSLGGSMESNVRYTDRRFDITLEGAQLHLKHGVTTIRDSYGILEPLLEVRDAIARGDVIGPRMYVAGNIVGWGGFFAKTFGPPDPKTLWEEQLNDAITRGSGEELILMGPDSLKAALHRYMDLGVDFVKYGGTVHMPYPTTLVFSLRQARAIVEAVHERGLIAETHATSPEGLRIALEAGVDLVQHPEALDAPFTDELIGMIVERGVICSMNVNSHTGKAWRDYLAEQQTASGDVPPDTARGPRRWPARERTSWEVFQQDVRPGIPRMHRENAERLIAAGCIVSVATDNDLGTAPELARDPNEWRARDPGFGTLLSIEGLVELGMTPMQAIVAATKHGAMASGALEEYGTIEAGKAADLLVMEIDPLEDIGRGIRSLAVVMREGRVVDFEALPTEPIYWRGTPE